VDLAQLMNDKKFDTTPYYSNIFDACKVGGKLYGIPTSFDYSLLTGSKASMPANQNPTLAEFVEKAKALPEGKTAFARQDAMQIFYSYLRYSYSDLVDTANHQARFDSPEFIQAMKDFKELIGENKSSENEQNAKGMMLDGSVAYNIESMSDPMALAMSRAILGEDLATSNVPTISGNGAGVFNASLMLGINVGSKNQDAAWEFIKTMLGEDIQGTGRLQGYPVLKSAAKAMIDEMKSGTSAEGFTRRMVLRIGDKEIEVKPLSDEDYNAILGKLGSLDRLQAIDPNIQKVLSEELPSFFDGQKTAEDVAALIQNRVNTVLNE
jgi:multiple sugar transport system substrate-binding protein